MLLVSLMARRYGHELRSVSVVLRCASMLGRILFMMVLFLSTATSIAVGQWKVIRVYDGDTITVKGTSGEFEVRFAAIDAPEIEGEKIRKGQPYSRKAKEHLEKLLLDKIVVIDQYGTDQNGHMLGEVFLDGKNLNVEMVRTGLAEVFDRGADDKGPDLQIYRDAEASAQEKEIGIWSLRSG